MYYIPTEDEWYKAAYYDPALNGGTGGYWDYPTGRDAVSARDMTEATNPGNNANYWSGSYLLGTYYRTNVGEFELSTSPFGTFDQGGNVWEWNETPIGGSRGLRGGSFGSSGIDDRFHFPAPAPEKARLGGRVPRRRWREAGGAGPAHGKRSRATGTPETLCVGSSIFYPSD